MRICSFLPSATEIVYALGLGDSLAAVSHECDFPEEALSKPKVVRSKFDHTDMTGQEIDSLVSEMARRGERIYEVDEEVLRQADPDLVLTQELCEVCAVSFEDVERAVVRLDKIPQVVSLDPSSMEDVLGDIATVGEFAGVSQKADIVVGGLRDRIDAVRALASGAATRPTVACIEWLDPLIVAGHWVPEMVEIAGGHDALAKPGEPSRRIGFDDLRSADPDILILMPCGFDVERAEVELGRTPGSDEWRSLAAVRNRRAYVTDAGSLFSRSGPRLVDSLEVLGKIVHPDLFGEGLPSEYAKRLDAWPSQIPEEISGG
ncbi:MAG: cobalamin-binding protein [Chloroflexi bacterium]|nr:cobalamin-binding protein [Chloroflexota bacterium]